MGDGFDNDYFELLKRAKPIVFRNSLLFEWHNGEGVPKRRNFHALIYSHYWLGPDGLMHVVPPRTWRNYYTSSNPNTDVIYKIYYQKEPHTKRELIIEKIQGKPPSYITKVVQ